MWDSWKRGCTKAQRACRWRTLRTYHMTASWRSVSVCLIRSLSFFFLNSLRLVSSWFASMKVGRQLGFLRGILQWVVLVLEPPLTKSPTNGTVHALNKYGFRDLLIIDGAVPKCLRPFRLIVVCCRLASRLEVSNISIERCNPIVCRELFK